MITDKHIPFYAELYDGPRDGERVAVCPDYPPESIILEGSAYLRVMKDRYVFKRHQLPSGLPEPAEPSGD